MSAPEAMASPTDDDAMAPPVSSSPVPSSPPSVSLGDLPRELMLRVIEDSLPEGFESLAMTCKAIHQLCTPFIAHHNKLHAQFTNFYYDSDYMTGVPPIPHSYALLERIAAEPIVARYIRDADFARDSLRPFVRSKVPVPADVDSGRPVVALFATSQYLKRANLDWRQYYGLVVHDYTNHGPGTRLDDAHFSQHAAAFVLTLLPNVRFVRLPNHWSPTIVSCKLVETIVSDARKLHNRQQHCASLAQVARFDFSGPEPLEPDDSLGLTDVVPFLALPRVHSSHLRHLTPVSRHPTENDYCQTLENVCFEDCDFDEIEIADFWRRTPRLKTVHFESNMFSNLFYEEPGDSIGGTDNWSIAKFLGCLEREAGERLEQLAINLPTRQTISPDRVSLRGFRRLRALALKLELLKCTLWHAARRLKKPVEILDSSDLEEKRTRLVDLLPESLTWLRIIIDTDEDQTLLLRPLFHQFVALRSERLPTLETIEINGQRGNLAFLDEALWKWLFSETKAAGVGLNLKSGNFWGDWDSDRGVATPCMDIVPTWDGSRSWEEL